MNELQVKTIELVPAEIDFNFDELSQVLDEQLAKYEGLEFTEKDAASCKKTITELNKGKKALNDYRKETKKELSKEITDFEAKCKNLSNKFDTVIIPLKRQHDEFEEDRKQEKREKIVPIVEKLIEDEGLNDKFSDQLSDIPSEYLNKSKTIKSITTELTAKAKHLGINQDKEEADKEIIKGHVELINAKNDTDLLDITYTALLDHDISVEEIKIQIENDAEIKVKNSQKKAEVKPPVENDVIYTEVYQVEGTEDQLEALEEYMSGHGIAWTVVDK